MVYPKPIKKGSKVGIVAPSGPLTESGRGKMKLFLDKWGLEPVYGKSVSGNIGFLSSDDMTRASDINLFFKDESIDAIFSARGGYGSQRIVPLIDKKAVMDNPKIFTGFSDITALHIFFNSLGLSTFHAPMPGVESFDTADEMTLMSFYNNVFGVFDGPLPHNKDNPPKALVEGKCRGTLAGGNLTLIASSVGTEYELDFSGKIVFFEEISEEPYVIDRLLRQLLNSGSIEKAEGFLLGDFTKCEPDSGKPPFYSEVVLEYFTGIGKPCICNIPCGHQYPNITLPMGRMAEIDGNSAVII